MAIIIVGFPQLLNDIEKLFPVLDEGTDLACVLIAASFLNEALGSLLEKAFVKSSRVSKLIEPRSTLGEIWNHAVLCYGSGLISKGALNNLDFIVQIRNKVAHRHLE
jgi:DNA-binding MltR family transcriptional regulator